MKTFLVIESRVFPLNKPLTSIGRDLDNTLVLVDKTISRRHAQIVQQGGQYFIIDLDSVGGTWVNGKRVTQSTPLRSGDIITLANTAISFQEDAAQIDDQSFMRTDTLKDTDPRPGE